VLLLSGFAVGAGFTGEMVTVEANVLPWPSVTETGTVTGPVPGIEGLTYRLSAYREQGWDPAQFPRTEDVYGGLLSLPLFPDLTDAEQDRVVEILLGLL